MEAGWYDEDLSITSRLYIEGRQSTNFVNGESDSDQILQAIIMAKVEKSCYYVINKFEFESITSHNLLCGVGRNRNRMPQFDLLQALYVNFYW